MKKWIYLLAFGAIWLFSSCHDVTVGYLMVDTTAGYVIDSLHIFNIKNEIQRLTTLQEEFKAVTADQQERLEELNIEIERLRNEISNYYATVLQPLWDAQDETEWDSPEFNALQEEIDTKEQELDELYYYPKEEAESEVYDINAQLANLAKEMGVEDPEIVAKKLTEYQNKIDFKLPWVTPWIGGIAGTEPLIYTVIGVKNEKQENADKFMQYIGTMGGGVIYVDINVDVPVGKYIITLQIENEGRTRILEDAFTFIVDDEAISEPENQEE